MGGLSEVPAPTLKEVEPAKTEPEKTGTYYSGYSRSWKKPLKPKPEPAAYTPYKPATVEPKKYTAPTLNYERKQAPVAKPRRRTYERRNRNGYKNYDDDNYISNYTNRYNGTEAKPHSHQSCLQRMLGRFAAQRKGLAAMRSRRIELQRGKK